MATNETRILDNIIASRRALLVGGGAALAAMAMPTNASAALTVSSVTDAAVLNFALNLEYLEANYYYLCAFGTTIDVPNTASTAAAIAAGGTGGAIGISGLVYQGSATPASGPGIPVIKTGAAQVPFLLPAVKAYAIETAIEEAKHVAFLRSALGSAAVAQPQIDLSVTGAWTTVASAATVASSFNPYLNDITFLLGAYVFEDVGVSAYHGAAPLLQQTAAGKQNLLAAGGILAVEAYHAGLVRTTLNALAAADPVNGPGYVMATQKISNLRATLANQAATTPNSNAPYDPNPDDYGLSGGMTSYSLGGTTVSGTQIVDADPTNVIAFARTTTQVLNIVTGGGGVMANSAAKGVFFPAGINGGIA